VVPLPRGSVQNIYIHNEKNHLIFAGPCIIVIIGDLNNQLDVTWYFIVLLIVSYIRLYCEVMLRLYSLSTIVIN